MRQVVINPIPSQDKVDANVPFEFSQEGAVATWWRQATPGTTYWRCYVPAKALGGEVLGVYGPENFDFDESTNTLTSKYAYGKVYIWQFLGDDARSRFAFKFQDQGIPTFQELDDTYLSPPPTHVKGGAWAKTHAEAEYLHQVGQGTGYSHEMHRVLTPQFDGLIVSTEKLANDYSKWNDNIHICPNSVDPSDWDVKRTESETLRIGYYASASHNRDWPIVKKAIKQLVREPGVEVVMIGMRPPGWGGKLIPWAKDIYEARQNLGQIDVGIAPLDANIFAQAKSDVKGLEYSMGGVLPVLQGGSWPYKPWDDIGWPFMPRTPEDWRNVLMDIVRNRDEIPKWTAKAKEYVLEQRTIKKNIHFWEEAISSV